MDHELNEWTSFLDTTVELVSKQSSEVLRATLLSLFATRYSVLNHWQYCECCCKLTHALAHENTQSHFMSKHSPSPQGFMYWVFCCTITRQSDLTPPRHRRAQLELSNLSGSPRCLVEFHSFRSLINSSFFLKCFKQQLFNCHVTCSQVYDAVNQEGMKADLKKSLANRSQNITNITLRWKCISNSQRAAARPWQHTCFEVVDSYCQLNKNPVSVELTVCVLAKGKNTPLCRLLKNSVAVWGFYSHIWLKLNYFLVSWGLPLSTEADWI